MSEDPDAWREPVLRQNVRVKIEDAIRSSGNPTTKNVVEMENHIFNKAKSREDYLALTARLILHINDISSKQKQSGIQPMMGQPTAMMTTQQSDPMSALQNMAGPQPMNEMSMNNQMHMTVGNVSDGTMMTGPGGIQQNIGQSQISQINLNQSGQFAPRGAPNLAQNRMMNQMMMSNGNMPNRPQQVLNSNLQLQLRARQSTPMNNMQMPIQGPNIDNKFYENQQMTSNNVPIQHQQFRPTMSGINQQQFQGGNVNIINANQMNNLQAPTMNQMPGTPQMASQMMPSPSGYVQSPQNVMASPHSNMIRQPTSIAGVPSPLANVSLNTPANVVIQSPNSQVQANRPMNEEQAYLEKLKQLSKYIEPLRNTINKFDQDERYSENRKKDLSKMKNLLEILSDPNRRCSMATLEKCEQVLERMDFKVKVNEPPPQPPPAPKIQDACQPLLDAILSNIKKPMFNHTLQRTFGPAVAALINNHHRPSTPPLASKKSTDQNDIPEVLQGEIARLESKFKVQMDSLQHNGTKSILLTCRLDDKDLPCVPAITMKVPELYPEKPPSCDIDILEYSSSSFFQDVLKNFTANLNKLPEYHSITSLLNSWELSVRQSASSSINRSETSILDKITS